MAMHDTYHWYHVVDQWDPSLIIHRRGGDVNSRQKLLAPVGPSESQKRHILLHPGTTEPRVLAVTSLLLKTILLQSFQVGCARSFYCQRTLYSALHDACQVVSRHCARVLLRRAGTDLVSPACRAPSAPIKTARLSQAHSHLKGLRDCEGDALVLQPQPQCAIREPDMAEARGPAGGIQLQDPGCVQLHGQPDGGGAVEGCHNLQRGLVCVLKQLPLNVH